MLHQCQVWLKHELKTTEHHDALLPAPLSQRCRDAMLACRTRPSRLQQSVGTTLAELCPGFEEEALEPSTGYSLDLALHSKRVAVEVDGPSHFLLAEHGRQVPNGPTLLKRRQLEAVGWRVLSVPYYEWDAQVGREQQRAYLERALRAIGLEL